MSISVKQLTQPSLRTQLHARTAKHVALELLPPPSSNEELYEEREYLYSAYGTTSHQILFPRKTERLVLSRPHKLQRKASAPAPRTPGRKQKIQWPDARNAKDIAVFYQNHLSPKSDSLADSKNGDSLYTLATLPALLRCAPVPSMSKATTHLPELVPSVVKPAQLLHNAAHPPVLRFGRAMNEA